MTLLDDLTILSDNLITLADERAALARQFSGQIKYIDSREQRAD